MRAVNHFTSPTRTGDGNVHRAAVCTHAALVAALVVEICVAQSVSPVDVVLAIAVLHFDVIADSSHLTNKKNTLHVNCTLMGRYL